MKKNIIPFVQDYIANLDADMGWHGRTCLESRSYARSAAFELLLYIKSHNTMPQSIAIEEFAKKMDDYSCLNLRTSSIFSVAHDVAMYFLDILLEEN